MVRFLDLLMTSPNHLACRLTSGYTFSSTFLNYEVTETDDLTCHLLMDEGDLSGVLSYCPPWLLMNYPHDFVTMITVDENAELVRYWPDPDVIDLADDDRSSEMSF